MKQACSTEALRAAIDVRGFSHRELATLAKCSRNTPYKLLNGRATGDETADRLARVLRRPVDELFVDAASSSEQQIDSREAVAS